MLLTGCSGGMDTAAAAPSEAHEDPAAVRSELQGQIQSLQDSLGGGWNDRDNPLAQRCPEGYYFSGLRVAQAPGGGTAEAADRVVSLLKERGLRVVRTSFAAGHISVSATAEDGARIRLTAEGEASPVRIEAQTGCLPGDAGELASRELAQLRGIPLPEGP